MEGDKLFEQFSRRIRPTVTKEFEWVQHYPQHRGIFTDFLLNKIKPIFMEIINSILSNHTVSLPPQPIPYNPQSTQPSQPTQPIQPTQSEQPTQPQPTQPEPNVVEEKSKAVLLIGINYDGSSSQLSGCINDVENVKKLLMEHYGFTEDSITLMREDSSDPNMVPTRRNMIDQLNKFVNCGKKVLWFHYSGHGSYMADRNGDELDGNDETLVPLDYTTNGMIVDDELNKLVLNQIPKDTYLISFFDCCHSGTQLDLPYVYLANKRFTVPSLAKSSREWYPFRESVFSRFLTRISVLHMRSLQGQLLVATSELLDPNFAQSVLLILQHNEEGALGLVLNQPLQTTVRQAWQQVSKLDCPFEGQLYRGGPCEGPLTAIHAEEFLLDIEVLPHVYASMRADHLEQLILKAESPLRFFAGTSGWAPGQLEAELMSGSWLTTPATAELIFSHDEELWDNTRREIAGKKVLSALNIKHVPGDVSSN